MEYPKAEMNFNGLEETDVEESEEGDGEIFDQIAAGALPGTVETVIALNLVYQEKLEEMIEKVDNAIVEKTERKVDLEQERDEALQNPYDEPFQFVRVPVLQYIPPYFRDSYGMAPMPNVDTSSKHQRKELDPLVEPARKWNNGEKAKLLDGVKASLIEKQLAPLNDKKSELVKQWKLAGVGDHASLKQAIAKIDKQIEKSTKRFDLKMLPEKAYEAVDWNKISVTDLKGTRTEMECRLAFFNAFHPWLNQDKHFSENEVKKLLELVAKYEGRNWPAIAREIGTGRSAFQCFEKYQMDLNPDILKKEWSKEEDNTLRESVETCRVGDYIPWEIVTGLMEGRTRAQCQARWIRKLNPSLKTGRWSDQEDADLKAAVEKYGKRGWKKIAKQVPGRTEAQCRERWNSALRDDIKTGPWTAEEDKTLRDAVQKFGAGKWSRICTLLNGRTPSACKIRCRSLSKATGGKRRKGKKISAQSK